MGQPVFIGVDPGAKGYICALRPDLESAEFISNSFEHPSQIYNQVYEIIQINDCPKIMIEEVHSIFGMSAKSNFVFGRNVGLIHGILAVTQKGIDVVQPKQWQKAVGVKAKGKAIKQDVADICKRLYPNINIYGPKGGLLDGKSDSLMIAHYCYLKYK